MRPKFHFFFMCSHFICASHILNFSSDWPLLSDAPKNTSVLARPSTVIDAGSSLTLTCSSQANPAVENYTWYRINAADAWETRSGPSYIIPEVSLRASGQYYCEARNRIGVHSSPVLTVKVRGWCATQCLFVEHQINKCSIGQIQGTCVHIQYVMSMCCSWSGTFIWFQCFWI